MLVLVGWVERSTEWIAKAMVFSSPSQPFLWRKRFSYLIDDGIKICVAKPNAFESLEIRDVRKALGFATINRILNAINQSKHM